MGNNTYKSNEQRIRLRIGLWALGLISEISWNLQPSSTRRSRSTSESAEPLSDSFFWSLSIWHGQTSQDPNEMFYQIWKWMETDGCQKPRSECRIWIDLSLSQMHKTRCYDYSPLHLPTSLSVKGHSLEHLTRTISLHVASLNAFTNLLDYSKHLPSNNSEETVAWPWWKISRRNCWNLIQFWYVLVLLIAALLVSAVTTGCGWLGVGLSDMAEDPRLSRVSWILHDDPKKWRHWWQQRY